MRVWIRSDTLHPNNPGGHPRARRSRHPRSGCAPLAPLKAIVADQVRLEEDANEAVLSFRVRADGLDLPDRLWYRFPREFAAFVAVNGDPVLPVALLAGMAHGRDVVVECEVSTAMLASSARIAAVYHTWSEQLGDGLAQVRVEAPTAVHPRRGTAAGSFFSGGVDSFHTLIRNLQRHAGGDDRLITHLIFVHGFDIPLEQTSLFELAYANVAESARAFDRTLVPVRTNIRRALNGLAWGRYAHGGALAAAAHALSGLFHTVYIPASRLLTDLFPWGSHPALDPLWSTEGTELVHDGAEDARTDKVALIAMSPVALRSLRVCWENRDGAYNCGRCEKCLRTMSDLFLYGALERAETFPKSLDVDAVGRLTIGTVRAHWRDTLARLKTAGSNPRLVAAIERGIRRGDWSMSPAGRAMKRIARYFK